MLILLWTNVIFMLVGIMLIYLGFRHRNRDKPYISFKNPFNPFKYKDHFRPPGYSYHLLGILIFELGAISGVVYYADKWLG